MKLIPYSTKSAMYQDKVWEYMGLLHSVPLPEAYSCDTATCICNKILSFIEANVM